MKDNATWLMEMILPLAVLVVPTISYIFIMWIKKLIKQICDPEYHSFMGWFREAVFFPLAVIIVPTGIVIGIAYLRCYLIKLV